jgi:hypothetical protein
MKANGSLITTCILIQNQLSTTTLGYTSLNLSDSLAMPVPTNHGTSYSMEPVESVIAGLRKTIARIAFEGGIKTNPGEQYLGILVYHRVKPKSREKTMFTRFMYNQGLFNAECHFDPDTVAGIYPRIQTCNFSVTFVLYEFVMLVTSQHLIWQSRAQLVRTATGTRHGYSPPLSVAPRKGSHC